MVLRTLWTLHRKRCRHTRIHRLVTTIRIRSEEVGRDEKLPIRGIEPRPQRWERCILTTRRYRTHEKGNFSRRLVIMDTCGCVEQIPHRLNSECDFQEQWVCLKFGLTSSPVHLWYTKAMFEWKGRKVPIRGIEPRSPRWKRGILTTRLYRSCCALPCKSYTMENFLRIFFCRKCAYSDPISC